MHRPSAAAVAALLVAAVAAAPAPVWAQQPPASPLMAKINDGNWLDPAEAGRLRDELFYLRAIDAYLRMLPTLNAIGIRDGFQTAFGKGYQVLGVWRDRINGQTWLPGANPELISAMGFADLRETGPLVVRVPPNVAGVVTDFLQRTVVEIGPSGSDRGRGGSYLILPPSYVGTVPTGYQVFSATTNNLMLSFSAPLSKGAQGPDSAPALAALERIRVHPLWTGDKDVKPMQFPNASGRRLDLLYPTDHNWWLKLKGFIDDEPAAAIDPETRGVLGTLGLVRGRPFEPTEGQRHLFLRALDTAPKMILATRQLGRHDGRQLAYRDRQWEQPWAGATAEFQQDGYPDTEARAAFFQYGQASAPSLVSRTAGVGSDHVFTVHDAEGRLLTGSKDYKLHLPADIPADQAWAVTLYNGTDGTLLETTRQPVPSLGSLDPLKTNPDGSVDLFFGPGRPAGAPESNWIQTVPGRDFLVTLRLYGPQLAFFDQTWRPDDLVKLN